MKRKREIMIVADKKIIKNGTLFQTRNKDVFVKIGKSCCKVDIASVILFCDLDAEEIQIVTNCNGKVIWWDKMSLIQDEDVE